MVEMLRAWHPLLHTSNVAPITLHFALCTLHYERQPVSPSLCTLHCERRPVASITHTTNVGPSHLSPPLRTSARRNKRLLWQICRFLRYPKLGAVGVDGFGAPVNDNQYRYRLQTGTSMIIVVIYVHKPKWEWLLLTLTNRNENDYRLHWWTIINNP